MADIKRFGRSEKDKNFILYKTVDIKLDVFSDMSLPVEHLSPVRIFEKLKELRGNLNAVIDTMHSEWNTVATNRIDFTDLSDNGTHFMAGLYREETDAEYAQRMMKDIPVPDTFGFQELQRRAELFGYELVKRAKKA